MSPLTVGHLVLLTLIFAAVSGKGHFHLPKYDGSVLDVSNALRFNHSELWWLEFSALSWRIAEAT